MTLNNNYRVRRCDDALRRYNDEWDVKSNQIDFLADARHWCVKHEQNFARLGRSAHDHYLAEMSDRRPT